MADKGMSSDGLEMIGENEGCGLRLAWGGRRDPNVR